MKKRSFSAKRQSVTKFAKAKAKSIKQRTRSTIGIVPEDVGLDLGLGAVSFEGSKDASEMSVSSNGSSAASGAEMSVCIDASMVADNTSVIDTTDASSVVDVNEYGGIEVIPIDEVKEVTVAAETLGLGLPKDAAEVPKSAAEVEPNEGAKEEEKKPKPKKAEWRAAMDPQSGNVYYYHTITKETTWEKPADFVPRKSKSKAKADDSSLATEKANNLKPKSEAKALAETPAKEISTIQEEEEDDEEEVVAAAEEEVVVAAEEATEEATEEASPDEEAEVAATKSAPEEKAAKPAVVEAEKDEPVLEPGIEMIQQDDEVSIGFFGFTVETEYVENDEDEGVVGQVLLTMDQYFSCLPTCEPKGPIMTNNDITPDLVPDADDRNDGCVAGVDREVRV